MILMSLHMRKMGSGLDYVCEGVCVCMCVCMCVYVCVPFSSLSHHSTFLSYAEFVCLPSLLCCDLLESQHHIFSCCLSFEYNCGITGVNITFWMNTKHICLIYTSLLSKRSYFICSNLFINRYVFTPRAYFLMALTYCSSSSQTLSSSSCAYVYTLPPMTASSVSVHSLVSCPCPLPAVVTPGLAYSGSWGMVWVAMIFRDTSFLHFSSLEVHGLSL